MKKRLIAFFIVITTVLSMLTFVNVSAADGIDYPVKYTFETDSESWTYWKSQTASSNTFSTEYYTEGKRGLFINDTNTTYAGGIQSPLINVEPGESYVARVDMYLVVDPMSLALRFYDSAQKEITITNNLLRGVEGKWESLEIRKVAPENAVYAKVIVVGGNATKSSAYIDNLYFNTASDSYIAPKQANAVDATLVAPVNNKLKYTPYTENGDVLGDFSYAGYYGGKYNVPDSSYFPVVAELSPSGTGDDTALIQAAIDKATRSDGGMNVVKFSPGKFYISKTGLNLKTGVILSGSGQGPTGTILYAFAPSQHNVIKIAGYQNATYDTYQANILDDYLPVGKKTFKVSSEDAQKFKVGDLIAITHPATDEWAKHIDMANITNVDGANTSWGGNNQNMVTERTITKIEGDEITIDIAVFVPLIKSLSQSYIQKVTKPGRRENIGIENLRIESYYNGNTTDESHAKVAISVIGAQNVYVKDVTSKYFYHSLINSGKNSKNVTAINCSCIEPVSKIDGSRRYSFAVADTAQQILYAGCYSSKGRHDYETSFEVTGPIVFLDSVADESYGGIETHGTWSTGVLYDNVYSISSSTAASIGIKNHGIYGSNESQGWTGVTSVIWNSLAPAIIVHRPPHPYQNFMVGSWGIYDDALGRASKNANIDRYNGIYRTTKYPSGADDAIHFATKDGSPFVGDGYVENEFTPVNPRSLFKAQLSERFTGVISNARPNAPTIEAPKYDKVFNKNSVQINGFYQLGANKVTLYIDDIPYDANLLEDNKFNFTKTFENGVHKLYATQTIDGVESTKSPDRFFVVNEEDSGYPSYLQSMYDISKTSLLINDPRMTYDEYLESLIVDELPENLGNIIFPIKGVSDGDNKLTVTDENKKTQEITGNYIVLPARVESKRGYEILKSDYGFLLSVDGENYDDYASKLSLKNDAYGLLFYNLKPQKYWFKQYVKYTKKDGITHIVYGLPLEIEID